MNRDNDKGKVLINRSLILGAGQLFLLLLLILRLYYLQVYQADKYKTLADENRISTRLLVPPRGVIYDRNGEMLATNRQNFQVMIVAEQTTNVQETLTPKELQVIKLRYALDGGEELPQRTIGQMLGISRSYVSRIEKKALKKLRVRLLDDNTM